MNNFHVLLITALTILMMSCVNGNTNGSNEQIDSVAVTATANPSSLAFVKIVDPLVEKYPNYSENSIAKETLDKELAEILKQYVGNASDTLFKGFPLEFDDVAPNGDKEAVVRFKQTSFPYSDKWDAIITVYCTMDKEEAAKLSNKEYTVTGTIQDWKPDDSAYSINLGKFLIKDAHATPYTF